MVQPAPETNELDLWTEELMAGLAGLETKGGRSLSKIRHNISTLKAKDIYIGISINKAFGAVRSRLHDMIKNTKKNMEQKKPLFLASTPAGQKMMNKNFNNQKANIDLSLGQLIRVEHIFKKCHENIDLLVDFIAVNSPGREKAFEKNQSLTEAFNTKVDSISQKNMVGFLILHWELGEKINKALPPQDRANIPAVTLLRLALEQRQADIGNLAYPKGGKLLPPTGETPQP